MSQENNIFDEKFGNAKHTPNSDVAKPTRSEPLLPQSAPSTPNKKNFNPDNIVARLRFPKDINPKSAIWLLESVNAILVAPVNSPLYDSNLFAKGYNFVVRLKDFDNFLDVAEKKSDEKIAKFCADMSKCGEQVGVIPSGAKESDMFWKDRNTLIDFTEHSFKTTDKIRNYVNFLYSWATDNVRNAEFTPEQRKFEEIFKAFLLKQIHKIEKAKSESEKIKLIKHVISSVLFDTTGMTYKINQFNNNIGKLKTTTPPSLAVVLDDGSRADLMTMDLSKPCRIMNYVDISKIKQPIDLSNVTINSDFVCTNAQAEIVFPKRVNGFINCSNTDIKLLKINKIPDGTTFIDFSGCVKDFADLVNINFPKSVSEIHLLRSMLNATCKNPTMLANFRKFQEKNPDIEIWDSKHVLSLQDLLKSELAKQESKKVAQNKTVVEPTPQPTIAQKTDDWLTRREISEICKQDERFVNIDTDIEKLIRYAIKSNNQIVSGNRLCDGQSVSCVHVDSVEILKQTILQIMDENANREKAKPVVEKVEKNATPKVKTIKTVKAAEAKPIKIEKYIPKQVWKNICNAYGNSVNLLYSVLERINKVNMNYISQTAQLPIQFIDEHQKKTYIPNTEVKAGKAATQHIENNDNRRIVWTINPDDKIMVATAFFADHGDNAQSMKLYNSVAIPNARQGRNMDGILVNKELVIKYEYWKVSKLLKEYKAKVAEKEQKATKAATPSEQPKRKRINPTTLVDVKAVEAQIDAFIEHLDTEIQKLTKQMLNNANNPSEQLENAQKIVKLLTEKVSLKQK